MLAYCPINPSELRDPCFSLPRSLYSITEKNSVNHL